MHRANVVVYLRRFVKPCDAEASAHFDDLDMGMGRKRHRRSKASLYQLVRGYSLFHSQGCANSPECPQRVARRPGAAIWGSVRTPRHERKGGTARDRSSTKAG